MGTVLSMEGGAWPKCKTCYDTGWVCEKHPWKVSAQASKASDACGCNAAMPCHCYTTRRAPHMEQYVTIAPVVIEDWPDAHHVFLKVGNQRFCVTPHGCETKDEAEWTRDMLCIALDEICKNQQAK